MTGNRAWTRLDGTLEPTVTITRGMTWRIAVIAGLYVLPVLVFAGFGAYFLWQQGYAWLPWIGFFACTITAYFLTMRWTRKGQFNLLPDPTYKDALPYWTDRDRTAWGVVEEHAKASIPPTMTDFSDPANLTKYATELQELANKVVKVYKPDAKDPFQHLTLTELMTAAELVAHDLGEKVEKYIPGSNLLTLRNFQQARTAMDVYQHGQNAYWLVSAIFNPFKTAVQLTANKLGVQSAFAQIQNNVLHWFFLSFLHEVGRYLIELNSGRLRVGAKRYLELMAKHQVPDAYVESETKMAGQMDTAVERVTIAVVGPVSAGKSSLINAIFGEQRAAVAQTPLTAKSTRYELNQAGLPPITLIDTVGFGVNGASEADVRTAVDAMTNADVVLMVVPARSAARAPEVEFLSRMKATFEVRPELRLPPVIGVLTQVDQLTPAMEWQPPYEWTLGTRTKEQSIREAVKAAGEAFADRVAKLVPVCTAAGRVWNVREELLPAVSVRLSEARGVSLLRALHLGDAIESTKKVVGQVYNAGKELIKAAWQGGRK
jgi:uncharacterized protein